MIPDQNGFSPGSSSFRAILSFYSRRHAKKKRGCAALLFVVRVFSSLSTHDREAIAAVDGPIGFGLEGHTSFLAAASTNSGEVLAGATSGILAGVAAGLATLGLVLETALSIKLLLTGGEHELLPTFLANQSLVLIHC